jgi:hypothetical protein
MYLFHFESLKSFILISLFFFLRYQLILDCWNFKSDQRPSFNLINEKLSLILEKYKLEKLQQMNRLDKVFNNEESESLRPSSKTFTNTFALPSLTNSLRHSDSSKMSYLIPRISPFNSNNHSTAPPLLLTINNNSNNNNSNRLCSSSTSTMLASNLPTPTSTIISVPLNKSERAKTIIGSDTEDSQYFSGADTSMVYADSSQFSSASSSVYSNYSVPISQAVAASKAASIMAASLAQTPPSPPPLKPSSKLMNLASVAYQI